MTTRKDFLASSLATGASAMLGGCRMFRNPEVGKPYTGWHEGEMDLHFIYTGCGENTFFRLPDGTTVLCDAGDFYRPQATFVVPLLPSHDLLGGEWVARYMRYVCGDLSPFREKAVDYAVFTHWHSDHIGHAVFDGTDGPGAAWRYRKTDDGRKINGFLCVAEQFRFRRYLGHQYPASNAHNSADSSIKLLVPWVDGQKSKGELDAESFKPGALDQIALVRNPRKYRADFHVRNICANGVLWDGAHGLRDYVAEHVAATGKDYVSQNSLSLGYVIEYGKFRFFTGGDVQGPLKGPGGKTVDYEGLVGERVGPLSVCKMNHHGCNNAMRDGFVNAVKAQTYIGCMWCPVQAFPDALDRMWRAGAHDGGRPLLLPQLVGSLQKDGEEKFGYKVPPKGVYHVIVKVFPGGERYRTYLVDPRDEDFRVLAAYDRLA